MAMIKIRRKPGNTLMKMTTAAFNMRFPLDQDVFEVPANYYAYLQNHFDVISMTEAGDSGPKPCWYKDKKTERTESKTVGTATVKKVSTPIDADNLEK